MFKSYASLVWLSLIVTSRTTTGDTGLKEKWPKYEDEEKRDDKKDIDDMVVEGRSFVSFSYFREMFIKNIRFGADVSTLRLKQKRNVDGHTIRTQKNVIELYEILITI